MIVFGSQYYRSSYPRQTWWDEDMKRIKQNGFSLIRAWLSWREVNRTDGTWDFSIYNRLFEVAEKNELQVLIQFNTELPPEWLIEKYPQARWIKSNGEPYIPFSADGMAEVGNYPGLTPDAEEARKVIEEFLERTVKEFKNNPALFGYDIWNEIMPFYGFKSRLGGLILYHPETQRKFREWLKNRYGTIEKLNNLYLKNCKSFDDISMPENGYYLEMLDLHEFGIDWIADYMSWKKDTINKHDRRHPVLAHTGGSFLTNMWEIAEPLDAWGTSCYETDFWKTAFQWCGMTRSAARGKPWGFLEMTGGRTWGLYGDNRRSPELLEQLPLLVFSYGGKYNVFFEWRPGNFGDCAPNFGLTNENGSFNEGTRKVARLGQALQKNNRLFDELEFPSSDVTLLIDFRSLSLEESAPPSAVDRKLTVPEYMGWFKALGELGANVEILYGSQVAKHGLPDNVKLLIAPLLNIERPGIVNILESFVAQGGHLIAGPYLLTYNSFAYAYDEAPPLPMQRIFGSRTVNSLYPSEICLEALGYRPMIEISGYHCLEVYECQEAVGWLYSGESVAGTRHTVGNSVRYRIGSLIGSAYLKKNQLRPDGFPELLEDILSAAGCSRHPASTGNVLVRLGKSNQYQLLFVHNTTYLPQTTHIKLETPVREAIDLVSDERISLSNEKEICLCLQPRESKVVRL